MHSMWLKYGITVACVWLICGTYLFKSESVFAGGLAVVEMQSKAVHEVWLPTVFAADAIYEKKINFFVC